jgi:hypothetical protein
MPIGDGLDDRVGAAGIMPIPSTRLLKAHEAVLLRHLGVLSGLDVMLVRDVDDGAMGSIEFVGNAEGDKRLNSTCQFVDQDNMAVVVDLHVWANGRPAELSFWKVDYSAVVSFPADETALGPVQYKNTH